MITVDVVVVTYHPGPDLRRCADSVSSTAGVGHRLTIVNNDPGDPLAGEVAAASGAQYLESAANVGFCAAVDRAIAATSEPYVLLLNPDAGIDREYLRRLVDLMEADPTIGAAGGRIIRDGPTGTSLDSIGIEMRRGRKAVDLGHGSLDDGRRSGVVERFGVTAAAALYRRSALEQVAVAGEVLPISFFMYLDDVDLAWRLRLAGYRSVVDDRAVAWHRRAIAGDRSGGAGALGALARQMAREAERPDYVRERSWVNHLLMLVRNDDSGAFLGQLPYYAARRLPGDLFGLAQRPVMAVRMRQRFLELLPRTIEERREIQARRVVGREEIARWVP